MANVAMLCSIHCGTAYGERVLSEHDKPCARAICTPIGNTNAAQDESNTCCKQQLVPSCMWHDVLLLVLPQVQHEHAHGDLSLIHI